MRYPYGPRYGPRYGHRYYPRYGYGPYNYGISRAAFAGGFTGGFVGGITGAAIATAPFFWY